jgi:hypothetical protein
MAASLLLSGCLTSPNAFYTDPDIFQDDRIIGGYADARAEDGYSVRKDPDNPGRYILHYFEKERTLRWMEFTATLFKAGTNSYVDLLPSDDSCIAHVPGAPLSGMDVIRNITRQPVHAVVRLALSDEGVAFSFPQKRAIFEMVQRHPTFTNYVRNGEILLLPQSSKELHDLLESEGGTLFPKPTDFRKPKPLPK